MKKNIVLIDYENVQKVNLQPLLELDVIVKVFHNESQKFTSDFTNLAIKFGKERIELIQISGCGKNAADFHIAYVIGRLAKEIENPFFHIISKDNGFKPLMEYMKTHDKVFCREEADIADIPLLKTPEKKDVVIFHKDHYRMVVDNLTTDATTRPKTVKSLRNRIRSICHNEPSEHEADGIIDRLVANKVVGRKEEYIVYCIGKK